MAASNRPSLEVDQRSDRGSRATRRLRKRGLVPGVVYGGGDCLTFQVGARDLYKALHAGSAVVDVKLDGDVRPVIVKDQQRHPVRDEIMHIDLLEVRLDEKIHSTVSVELTGQEEAPGVKEGGVIEHVTRELHVEALPTDLPEVISVDVSHLEAAQTMQLAELTPPEGVVFLDDPDETTIATVTIPTEVEEPEIEEETELVGEDGEPIEGEEAPAEGAEGEAPAEGDAGEGGGERSEGGS
jgi:large subunit ribosomal protein L25